jgi:hypothetical protein
MPRSTCSTHEHSAPPAGPTSPISHPAALPLTRHARLPTPMVPSIVQSLCSLPRRRLLIPLPLFVPCALSGSQPTKHRYPPQCMQPARSRAHTLLPRHTIEPDDPRSATPRDHHRHSVHNQKKTRDQLLNAPTHHTAFVELVPRLELTPSLHSAQTTFLSSP